MKSSSILLYAVALIGAISISGNALDPSHIATIKAQKETLIPFSRMMKVGYRTSIERA